MSKLVKIFLSVIAAVFLIIVIAAFALPFLFSPNDFKPEIEAAVKDKTGRELNITGDLELSVFPWLGIKTGKVVLNNAPNFDDKAFAEVDRSSIKVKLLPLLSKKIEIDRVVLEGLSLHLVKNKQGLTNWEDLKPASDKAQTSEAVPETTPEAVPESRKDLAIAGIALKNARVEWNDQKAGDHFLIKALNLDTDALVFSKPIDIKLDFIFDNPKAKTTESVKLATALIINEKIDRFTFNAIDLSSQTRSESVPGGVLNTQITAEMALDLASQTLKLSDVKISSGDLVVAADISGTAIKDNPAFEGAVSIAPFNPAKLLSEWDISVPNMRDANALSRLSADFNLQASPSSADLQDLVIRLDDSMVKGNTRIDNFSQPAVTFNLAIDSVDLDRYLAPEPQQQSASKPIASPAAAVAAGASLFPVETLKKLNINGLLSIDKVKVNNLSMQGFTVKLTANNGSINTNQSVKELYQGSYKGTIGLNVRNPQPTLALNERLTNVQIEPLLKDLKGKDPRITGLVDASARLRGTGNNAQALKATLTGQLSFAFKNGVVKGINLQQIIDDAKSIIKGTPLITDNPKDQTVFSEINGTANVTNGLIINNDLTANSSKLRVTGEGSADLKTEQLNYKLDARLIKAKATDTEPEKLSSLPVLININGTFSKPVYTLDVANMLIEKNKEKIEQKKEELLDKLDKKLEKKLGPGGAKDLLKRFF